MVEYSVVLVDYRSCFFVSRKAGRKIQFCSDVPALFAQCFWGDISVARVGALACCTPPSPSQGCFLRILLPFAQIDLSAEVCSRVVCSDAAPGGHGLAYGRPKGGSEEVHRWARMSEFKGA